MSRLSISLFGPFQVTLDGKPVLDFESDKVRALLTYLAVEADRPHRRETLAGLLWPDVPERSARTSLRNALANLRRTIGDHQASPPFLHITRQTIQFNSNSNYWLDLAAFRALLEADHTAQPAIEQLEDAIALYQGRFLEGFSIPDSTLFEEWILLKREELGRQVLQTLHHLADHYEQQGRYDQALPYAWRQLELEPWQEEAHQQAMRLLALSGWRSEALAQYDRCRRALAEELEVEPTAETAALYEQILSGELEQKIDAVRAVPRHNLPLELTPFTGRGTELAELTQLLADPELRLVTVVGPGGSGKTRLALEAAARQLNCFADGVYLVSLAPLQSAEAIVPAIANALGFTFYPGGNPQQQLLAYLRQKTMLLLMDNFEHLPEGVGLLIELLQAAPRLKLLVTSRTSLKVQGEQRFPLMGLDFPEGEGSVDRAHYERWAHYSALRLFWRSARRLRPDFRLTEDNVADVAQICRLVQGLPLGVLLAAAWIETLSPAEIAAEVSQGLDFLAADEYGLPERQRSMRAVFNHSWRMLSEVEGQVFTMLSVFRGGFSREAAEAVTGASLPVLRGLVNKSFLQHAQRGRYEVHELLRQYAQERLEASGQAETARTAHCTYYTDFLGQREADLKDGRQVAALTELETEHGNVEAAWRWAVVQKQVAQLDQAIEGLALFYQWRGRYQAGETACRLAAKALADMTSAADLRILVKLLTWQGFFNWRLGHTELANQLLLKGLALLDGPELGGQDTRSERAAVLLRMSMLVGYLNFEEVRRLTGQSLALYQDLGDRWGQAEALYTLGQIAENLRMDRQAKQWFEESLALRRALGDQRGIGNSLAYLGFLIVESEEQPEEAERLARESLAVRYEIGDRLFIAEGLADLAGVSLWGGGKFAEAQALYRKSAAIYNDLGVGYSANFILDSAHLGFVKMHLGKYEGACEQLQQCFTLAQETDYQYALGLSLLLLGMVDLVMKMYIEGQRLMQNSIAVFQALGLPDEEAIILANLGLLARSLGNHAEMQQYLSAALQTVAELRGMRPLLYALPATALFLADQGEGERAVELYALASRHPHVANSRWYEDVAGRHIATVAETLPPEVVAAAQGRGRARDVWQTAEELLAELER